MISILAGGGGPTAALAAAALMNSRFLPMGAALAPSLPGGWLKRAAQGQTVVDVCGRWPTAARGASIATSCSAQPPCSTSPGSRARRSLGGSALPDPEKLGLDAILPAFFLGLLIAELRDALSGWVALAGALIALALVPIAPAGVPVLAASVAALAGLRRRRRAS